MRTNFRTYNLAVQFYRQALTLKLPRHLKDQLHRAASSVVLNLSEGAGRATRADQGRFFSIAFGSLRECQSILDLAPSTGEAPVVSADILAAHIYKLIKSTERG